MSESIILKRRFLILCTLLLKDRVVFAGVVQKNGRSVLHRQGQGSSRSRCSTQDRRGFGSRERQQRGQDRVEQARRGVQDQLQREIRRVEKAQRWRHLGCQVVGAHCQAREAQGSRDPAKNGLIN